MFSSSILWNRRFAVGKGEVGNKEQFYHQQDGKYGGLARSIWGNEKVQTCFEDFGE
jgi:hypothetical protein